MCAPKTGRAKDDWNLWDAAPSPLHRAISSLLRLPPDHHDGSDDDDDDDDDDGYPAYSHHDKIPP